MHDPSGSSEVQWAELSAMDWSNFALVLGAGGATGDAFEVGTLLALSTDHRVQLAHSTAWVGISAGAIAASLLTMGFEAADMAAVLVEADRI
jgi:predicted acylesterase/phospholipase RssA